MEMEMEGKHEEALKLDSLRKSTFTDLDELLAAADASSVEGTRVSAARARAALGHIRDEFLGVQRCPQCGHHSSRQG